MDPGQGRLHGRSALITGGSSGIGRAISVRYAQEGANVVVADLSERARSEEELSVSTVELIKSAGGNAIFCKVDITDSASIEGAIQRVVQEYGRLDVYVLNDPNRSLYSQFRHAMKAGRSWDDQAAALTNLLIRKSMVNNAGVFHEISDPAPIWDTTDEMWNSTHSVNSKGTFNGVRAAAGQMIKQEPLSSGDRGWIINLSSIYGGYVGGPGSVAYCASKASVVGLTQSAALDCAQYRVHVNAICPGYTQSAMSAPLATTRPELQKSLQDMHPFRGLGRPEDIAKMAVFLGSDEASWCTGVAYAVDGGFLAQ